MILAQFVFKPLLCYSVLMQSDFIILRLDLYTGWAAYKVIHEELNYLKTINE